MGLWDMIRDKRNVAIDAALIAMQPSDDMATSSGEPHVKKPKRKLVDMENLPGYVTINIVLRTEVYHLKVRVVTERQKVAQVELSSLFLTMMLDYAATEEPQEFGDIQSKIGRSDQSKSVTIVPRRVSGCALEGSEFFESDCGNREWNGRNVLSRCGRQQAAQVAGSA